MKDSLDTQIKHALSKKYTPKKQLNTAILERKEEKHRMKKKMILGAAVTLSIALGVGYSYFCLNEQTVNKAADIAKLPVYTIKSDSVIDTDNEREYVGYVDYVFLGKVVENEGTHYEDIVMSEDENGNPIELGTPYTDYKIQIEENIKGELTMDEPIDVTKQGGVAQDHKSVMLFEDDCLPEVGKEYVFLAYAQPDGSLLISGSNSNILKEVKMQSEDIVEEYEEAAENEIVEDDRLRFRSKYEEN